MHRGPVIFRRRRDGTKVQSDYFPAGSNAEEQSQSGDCWHLSATMEDLARAPEWISPPNKYQTQGVLSLADGSQPSWYGGLKSWQEAESLARMGWTAGVERAEGDGPRVLEAVTQPESIRRVFRWHETGDDLSVERVLQHRDEVAFRDRYRKRTNGGNIVALSCGVGGNANRPAEDFYWSGLQLLVGTALLEEAGYRVETHALFYLFASGGCDVLVDVTVKLPQEKLEPGRVMAVFGHAGVWRALGHALLCGMPINLGFGLGQVQPMGENSPYRSQVRDGLYPEAPNTIIIPTAYNSREAKSNLQSHLKLSD